MPKKTEYVTRNLVLDLLSDAEVASVSTAETAAHLGEGDEYLDLEKLEDGVQTADGVFVSMGQVLPRRNVREATWAQILAQLKLRPGN